MLHKTYRNNLTGKTEEGKAPFEAPYPKVRVDKIVSIAPRTIVFSANLYHKGLRIAIRCWNDQGNQRLMG